MVVDGGHFRCARVLTVVWFPGWLSLVSYSQATAMS